MVIGVGLNLVRANNVISLDLGWSQAIESQAFDRVHRLGQTRDVHVQRVVIADTVEDRILTMQERKVCNLCCTISTVCSFHLFFISKRLLMEAWEKVPERKLAVSVVRRWFYLTMLNCGLVL